jgi:N-acetylmuramic acid 6-phosphate etherase
MSTSFKEKAAEFLKISPQFKLGHLVTEGFHPETTKLSQLAKADVEEAHKLLQVIDRMALYEMKSKEKALWELAQDIQDTLQNGHKVFMCGCGATGRLSLVLETLYRQEFGQTNQVISFMAGGDFALIKSVESFEDRTDFGERQLMELGFGPHDLLLASSEGGETPFVIGAANKAADVSSRKPYFLYCNPDSVLVNITRSKAIIDNPQIKKINLSIGPMAISGSTRMQASTVLMLGIGVGLLYEHKVEKEFGKFYQDFLNRLTNSEYSGMSDLTLLEAKLYQEKKFLNYVTDPYLAISILTDTTERSPTFSLRAFENKLDPPGERSLSYLFIPEANDATAAWNELLWRAPRPVEWTELEGRISLSRIYGFDISALGLKDRSKSVQSENFTVKYEDGEVRFQCQKEEVIFSWGEEPLLNHLMVKMILNAHSTLIMGLLDRYEGNVMTWVRPSNNKLVDRSARYILQLLKQRGKVATYEEVVEKIFEESETIKENEPIVLKVVARFE